MGDWIEDLKRRQQKGESEKTRLQRNAELIDAWAPTIWKELIEQIINDRSRFEARIGKVHANLIQQEDSLLFATESFPRFQLMIEFAKRGRFITSSLEVTHSIHSESIEPLDLFFHKRLCGPLANSRFHHTPNPTHRPNSKLEAAYHKADKAIESIIDLLAAT